MKRVTWFLAPVLVIVLFSGYSTAQLSPAAEAQRPTVIPDRVTLTFSGDPATTQAVTWRTSPDVTDAKAQIIAADPSPSFEERAKTVSAITTDVNTSYWPESFHTVVFEGLLPDTLYCYRVGDGVSWSEWFQFRTASDKPSEFSFVFMGDPQKGLDTVWPRVLRESFKADPDARFLLISGDIIDKGIDDVQWGEFFDAGAWYFGMVPFVPVTGSHEHYKNEAKQNLVTPLWRAEFELPRNGPEELAEYTYYFDYQGLRVVVLASDEMLPEQAVWLENVLKENPNKWTVVSFHRPVFSISRDRDNKDIRETWKPIIDKYKVDLVLTGHDHGYSRTSLTESTVYVVSVSGGKMYDLQWKPWMKRAAELTQLFQVITIDGDKLSFETRTATGSLYDAFELQKRKGKPNLLVDKIPAGVGERYRKE